MVKKKDKKRRLETLIAIVRSWKGPPPDYDNPDFSGWNQTEAEYQEEQRRWLESRRKKGHGRSKPQK